MKKCRLILPVLLCGSFLLPGMANKTPDVVEAKAGKKALFDPCNGSDATFWREGDTIYEPSWENFSFMGWYDQQDGGELIFEGEILEEEYELIEDGKTYYAHWSADYGYNQIITETIYFTNGIDYSTQPYSDFGIECDYNETDKLLTVYMSNETYFKRIEVTCDALFTIKNRSADVYIGSFLIGDGTNKCNVSFEGIGDLDILRFYPLKAEGTPFRPFAVRANATMNLNKLSCIAESVYEASTIENSFGGAVYVQKNGIFNIDGGMISNCMASYGGAVYVSGTFNLKSGSIETCGASYSLDNTEISGRGGAVFVAKYGTFNFSGGNISQCSAGLAGGAIYSHENVNISGDAHISYNQAYSYGTPKTKGGGIYMLSGTLTMSGGEIDCNRAGYRGGGIYLAENSNAVITGGTIDFNFLEDPAAEEGTPFAGVGIFDRGNLSIGGNARIFENTLSNGLNNNLYIDEGTKIVVTQPDSDFDVNISVANESSPISEPVEDDYSAYLTCDNFYKFVTLTEKNEYILKDKVTIDTCGGSEVEFHPYDFYLDSPHKDDSVFIGWYTEATGGDLIVDPDGFLGEKYEDLPYGITYYAHYATYQNEVGVLMSDYTYGGTVSTPTIDGELKGNPGIKFYVSGGNLEDDTEWKDIGPTTLSAGSYCIYAKIESTNEYIGTTTNSAYFDVLPAELTVTAKNKTISWGEEYVYEDGDVTIEGFVGGETIADLTGTLSCSTSYEEGCSGGTYELSPYGLESDNYTINYVDGVLTVSKVENEIVEFNVYNWKEGERPLWPDAYSKYGDVEFMFSKNTDQKSFDEDIPTEPGNYICKAYVVGNDSYGSCMEEKEFTIYKSSENKPIDENNNIIENPKVTIIDSQNGLDPNAELLVKVVASDDVNINGEVKEQLKNANFFNKEEEEVYGIYDAKLLIDGVETQPNGNITIKMYIPEDLVGKEFNLYHIHTETDGKKTVLSVNYNADGEFLTFTTDKLSYFAFVGEKAAEEPAPTPNPDPGEDKPCLFHFVLIGIAAVTVAFNLLWYFFIVKKHDENNKNLIERIVTIAVNAVCLVLSILFGIIGISVACKICIAFLIINVLLVGAGIVLNLFLKADKNTNE